MPTMRCTFPLLPRHVGNPGRVVVFRLLHRRGWVGAASRPTKKRRATAQQAPDGPRNPIGSARRGRQSTECFVSQLGSMTADTKFSISVCAMSRVDRPGTLPEAMLSRCMSAT
jgi:hypothetical protein